MICVSVILPPDHATSRDIVVPFLKKHRKDMFFSARKKSTLSLFSVDEYAREVSADTRREAVSRSSELTF